MAPLQSPNAPDGHFRGQRGRRQAIPGHDLGASLPPLSGEGLWCASWQEPIPRSGALATHARAKGVTPAPRGGENWKRRERIQSAGACQTRAPRASSAWPPSRSSVRPYISGLVVATYWKPRSKPGGQQETFRSRGLVQRRQPGLQGNTRNPLKMRDIVGYHR